MIRVTARAPLLSACASRSASCASSSSVGAVLGVAGSATGAGAGAWTGAALAGAGPLSAAAPTTTPEASSAVSARRPREDCCLTYGSSVEMGARGYEHLSADRGVHTLRCHYRR